MKATLALLALACRRLPPSELAEGSDGAEEGQGPEAPQPWAWDSWEPEPGAALARGPLQLTLDCPPDPVDPWDLGSDFLEMQAQATDLLGRSAGLGYDWHLLAAPEGAYPGVFPAQDPHVLIYPNVVGDYEYSLSVTTADGLHRAEGSCSLRFAPVHEVHVELASGEPNIQVLLHVIAYGGGLFERGYDLTYGGRCDEVDWGRAEGEPEPARLMGTGRDHTPYQSVRIPALEATTYQIAAHVDRDLYRDTNPARLRLWVDGELWVEEWITLVEGEVWYAGVLDGEARTWSPDGHIEPMGVAYCW